MVVCTATAEFQNALYLTFSLFRFSLAGVTVHAGDHFSAIIRRPSVTDHFWYWYDDLKGRMELIVQWKQTMNLNNAIYLRYDD